MQAIRTGWLFFQDQILGMKWLNALIGSALEALGIPLDGVLGGALQFFLYDTIKIFVLLSVLIFGISYIQSYSPPPSAPNRFWAGSTASAPTRRRPCWVP